ncbi:MAG: bifunctional hydroxymethylpyrimidine kinase/phosphomethylpyrimidine kinase [Alphaproteobacteria bacterium]|nr:bifunctional hydroxymethylpyrimidine kinase/phosphomethylpyrimidine kinase [Alphaproteobacteria bacterium]
MRKSEIPKILIIAGSDPSGAAGIQADIKTACAHEVYAASVITCLTAQNTKKFFATHYSPADFLRQQIEVVLADIQFDAIKIGMLGSAEIIECVADVLKQKAKNIPLILDPVMIATSGGLLLEKNALEVLKSRLIPLSYLLTPNIHEAEILAEMPIKNTSDMRRAALRIKALGCKAVLLKGGHLENKNNRIHHLLLTEKNIFHSITNKKLPHLKARGTGCTLASALTCNLAKKMDLPTATRSANRFVARCLQKNS